MYQLALAPADTSNGFYIAHVVGSALVLSQTLACMSFLVNILFLTSLALQTGGDGVPWNASERGFKVGEWLLQVGQGGGRR